jgi:hypothetical protein
MGARRGRRRFAAPRRVAVALGGAIVAASLLGGCGAEEHANEPRLQPPTRVSVAISEEAITVQPRRIAIGPEPTQQIPQNVHAEQPAVDSKEPLNVVLVAANLTDVDSRLELRGTGKDFNSQPLYANSNGSMQAILPTGVYRVGAADIPGAGTAKLVVGPYRSSSENDVLLP